MHKIILISIESAFALKTDDFGANEPRVPRHI